MKSLKSSTPKLTTEGDANFYTLSVGQGMKVLMKKPLGYQQLNSITHKNSLQISILITPENPVLYKINMTSKTITLKKQKETKKNKNNYVAIPFLSLITLLRNPAGPRSTFLPSSYSYFHFFTIHFLPLHKFLPHHHLRRKPLLFLIPSCCGYLILL